MKKVYVQPDFKPAFVGRSAELNKLMKYLETKDKTSSVVVILGEAGVGKTRLITELRKHAESKDIKCISGTCVKHAEPYHPFVTAISMLTNKNIFVPEEYTSISDIFIVNNAGILVSYASSSSGSGKDREMVSAMLTAVQQFVRDSFGDRSAGTGGLGKLEYKDTKILIEHGKNIFAAGVISGDEHTDMRIDIQQKVKTIEQKYGKILETWDGDHSKVKHIKNEIQELISKRYPIKRLEKYSVETHKVELFEKVLHVLTNANKKNRILMLIDDLHWADENTLEMLNYLSQHLSSERILICCTARGEELNEKQKEILLNANIEKISLNPLKPNDITALISSVFLGAKFPSDFVMKLYAETDGNPFYVIEILKALYDEKIIRYYGDGYVLRMDNSMKYSLPVSLSNIISSRISRLDDTAIRVLEYASVVGTEILPDIISNIMKIDKRKTVDVLSTLENYGLLRPTDNNKWVFEHAIIQNVIYKGISGRWKSIMHRNVGFALENIHKDHLEDVVYQLALHFTNGEIPEKAIRYSLWAGTRANSLYAYSEAIKYYENALSFIEKLPDSERNRMMKTEILISLTDIFTLTGDITKAREYGYETIKLGIETANTRVTGMGYRYLAKSYLQELNFDKTLEKLSQAMSVCKGIGDVSGSAETYFLTGTVYMRMGRLTSALDAFGKSSTLIKRIGLARLHGEVLANIGKVYYLTGDYRRALSNYFDAIDIFEKQNNRYKLSHVYNEIGDCYTMMNEYDDAKKYYDMCIKTAKDTNNLRDAGYGLCGLAYLLINRNEYNKAKELVEESIEYYRKTNDKTLFMRCLMVYGMIFRKKKDWNKAIEYFSKCIEIGNKIKDLETLGIASLEYGITYKLKGEYGKSIDLFYNAERIYRLFKNKKMLKKVITERKTVSYIY